MSAAPGLGSAQLSCRHGRVVSHSAPDSRCQGAGRGTARRCRPKFPTRSAGLVSGTSVAVLPVMEMVPTSTGSVGFHAAWSATLGSLGLAWSCQRPVEEHCGSCRNQCRREPVPPEPLRYCAKNGGNYARAAGPAGPGGVRGHVTARVRSAGARLSGPRGGACAARSGRRVVMPCEQQAAAVRGAAARRAPAFHGSVHWRADRGSAW